MITVTDAMRFTPLDAMRGLIAACGPQDFDALVYEVYEQALGISTMEQAEKAAIAVLHEFNYDSEFDSYDNKF